MRQITLSLREETIASLHRDFEAFMRLSLKLDPQFVTPTFEDFLRAKLLDNDTPLTEQAVQRMLTHGQYAWAKRALDKEFPDVVEILIRQAAEHGFAFAIRADWTAEDLIKASRAWATAIVTEAKGDVSQVDMLASQIKSAAADIREVEEKMQTPAWRLADSLRQRVYETKIAVETSVGSTAREKLGELRVPAAARHFLRVDPEAGSAAGAGISALAAARAFRRRALRRLHALRRRGCAASLRASQARRGLRDRRARERQQ